MKKSNIILLTIALCCLQAIQAQTRCGFDVLHKKIMDRSPVYKAEVNAFEQQVQSRGTRSSRSGIQVEQMSTSLYTIPVVVHVVHTGGPIGSLDNPTDAQIMGAIDHLNSIYNGTLPGLQGVGDIQIQFQLATRDPNCGPTSGINRINGSSLPLYASNGVNAQTTGGEDELSVKNLIRWDPTKYYNIWVVNKFDGQDGTSGTYVGGFAYFPGAPQQYDGTMILATQMAANRKTLPHEMGHAFAVYHPFQGASGSTCPVETDCATQGDRVCDTDPVTQSFACRTGSNNDCTGTPYTINTENNFMGYSSCSNLFTAGQKARMLAAAATSFRSYAGSWALTPTYPLNPFTPPVAASCSPVTGATGLSSNYGGVLNVSLNGISVNSGTSYTDGGYRNNATSCQSLFYLEEGQTYSISLKLYGLNAEQAKLWIDFDNDGNFNNAEELIGSVNEGSGPGSRPNGLTVSIPLSIPPSAVKDQVIRMRVVEDLSTIYGVPNVNTACQNPQYGQAEDYPVLIRSLALLPVELVSFTGTAEQNNAVLRWQTSLEQNSARFDLERSTNGQDYTKIGEVAAKGVASTYQYNDRNLAEGEYYYRLKQVDKNGRSTYSRSVRIAVSKAINSAYRILNNPASSYVDINMPLFRQDATARVLDMGGRLILTRNIPSGTANYRMQGIDKLSPGLYLIEINNGTERKTLKFIKN